MQTAESTGDDQQQTEQEIEGTETEQPSGETPPAEGADEVVVTIGDGSPPSEEEEEAARAPEWVRELRKTNREQARRIKELEAKHAPAADKADDPGAKPTLAGCDFDGDKFEAELLKWNAAKQAADAKQAEKQRAEEDERKAWQARQDAHSAAKAALKVADYDDAEDAARELFSITQQGIILQGAENSAVLVYALGKNQAKAKELAAIKDPVQFAFAVAKLESQLKVSPKKGAPAPEKKVGGNAPVSGAGADATLAKLEAEADRTGDRSKVIAYKRSRRTAE